VYAELRGQVIWTFGRLCAALALVVLLAACGSYDDTAGADGTSTTQPTVTVTSASSPESVATPIATSGPVTATLTSEPTEAASPEATASPPDEFGAELGYAEVAAWDVNWEGLGAIVLGPDGRLYLDDYLKKQMMVFTTDGSELDPLAYTSEHPDIVLPRSDLAVGADGRLYLLEQAGGSWIRVYTPDGTLVNGWGGTVGFEDDSLFDARTIAVAPDGHIFTTRPGGLLQKFTNDGEFVAAWDRAGEYLFPLEVYDMEAADGALYLAVSGFRDEQNAILTFDFDGNLVAEPLVIGESGDEDRIVPWSLAVGPAGNFFIGDVFRREVIILTPAGDELARWPLGSTDQRFPTVEIAVDDAGRVYVADDDQKAILVYAPE
jgi:hypothetical protein